MRVSPTYAGAGDSYHSGAPRQRMHIPENRTIKADYMRMTLDRWLANDVDACLEFGAGFGQNLLRFPGSRKVAYEPSGTAREVAAGYGELEVVDTLPERAEFDLVLSNHSLEHTIEPLGDLETLGRCLKPGGRLIIVVPSERNHEYTANELNHHLYSWTRLTLGNLVHEAGFMVEDVYVEHRALEFRLSRLRTISPRLWLAGVRLAGRLRRSSDIVAVARKPAAADSTTG